MIVLARNHKRHQNEEHGGGEKPTVQSILICKASGSSSRAILSAEQTVAHCPALVLPHQYFFQPLAPISELESSLGSKRTPEGQTSESPGLGKPEEEEKQHLLFAMVLFQTLSFWKLSQPVKNDSIITPFWELFNTT